MRIQTGKKQGKTTEELLLKEPDWAQWMSKQLPDSSVSENFRALRRSFDRRKFIRRCAGCTRVASRATAYRGTGRGLMFWCDDCDPYRSSKLNVIRTFDDALEHVDLTCNGVRVQKRAIIRELAEGKGLPHRVSEKQAIRFFID